MKLPAIKHSVSAAILLVVVAVVVVCGWMWFRSKYAFEIVLDMSRQIDPVGLNIAPRIDDSGTVVVQWSDGYSHPIFRIENGKPVRLSGDESKHIGIGASFGLIGKSVYYGVGPYSMLTRCEGDREIPMHASGEMSGAAANVKFAERFDSDGDTLVFWSQDQGFAQDHGVFSYRGGRFESVKPYEKSDSGFLKIYTADDIVYVLDSELLKATNPDGTTTTIVSRGDQVPNGRIGRVSHFSARAGAVAFTASTENNYGNGVYLKRDGQTTLIAAVEKGQSVTYTDVCTNGETVVFAEEKSGGWVDLGKFNHTRINHHRLFVYRDGKLKVLARAGDSMFGDTLGRIAIGPHGINSSGEIAFRYYLASGRFGIGKASPRH